MWFIKADHLTITWTNGLISTPSQTIPLSYIRLIQVQLDVHCILYFFSSWALHVSGAIWTHHQEHNCSVQPYVVYGFGVLFHCSRYWFGTPLHFGTVSYSSIKIGFNIILSLLLLSQHHSESVAWCNLLMCFRWWIVTHSNTKLSISGCVHATSVSPCLDCRL
jgi:hypothetical protein